MNESAFKVVLNHAAQIAVSLAGREQKPDARLIVLESWAIALEFHEEAKVKFNNLVTERK